MYEEKLKEQLTKLETLQEEYLHYIGSIDEVVKLSLCICYVARELGKLESEETK